EPFLNSAKSQFLMPGPHTEPLPELPKVPWVASAKHEVSNHFSTLRGPLLGSQPESRLAYCPKSDCTPASSPMAFVTVYGVPVARAATPESCQPPRTALARFFSPLKKGSSYT